MHSDTQHSTIKACIQTLNTPQSRYTIRHSTNTPQSRYAITLNTPQSRYTIRHSTDTPQSRVSQVLNFNILPTSQRIFLGIFFFNFLFSFSLFFLQKLQQTSLNTNAKKIKQKTKQNKQKQQNVHRSGQYMGVQKDLEHVIPTGSHRHICRVVVLVYTQKKYTPQYPKKNT